MNLFKPLTDTDRANLKAFKEGRGELAVWCDIVGGEGK